MRIALVIAVAAFLAMPSMSLAETRRDDGAHLCPKGFPELGVAEGTFKAERLVGLRLKRARRTARQHECTVRIVKLDGEWLVVTEDFRPNRINVKVEDERITGIQGIG